MRALRRVPLLLAAAALFVTPVAAQQPVKIRAGYQVR